ncbi:hypothetical protein [Paraglaciecola aestuariivivens]
MMSLQTKVLILVCGLGCAPSFAKNINLNELTKGTNKTVYIGSTSGLVSTSVDSVNSMANKQYRDSQRYSNSSSSSSYSDSNTSSSSSSSRSSSRSTSSSSSVSSRGVKEVYNAGTKTKGFTNYRVNCKSRGGITVHKRSDGFWYNVTTKTGEKYRHLSAQDFAKKYCG